MIQLEIEGGNDDGQLGGIDATTIIIIFGIEIKMTNVSSAMEG